MGQAIVHAFLLASSEAIFSSTPSVLLLGQAAATSVWHIGHFCSQPHKSYLCHVLHDINPALETPVKQKQIKQLSLQRAPSPSDHVNHDSRAHTSAR